jgi:hypothetical protein
MSADNTEETLKAKSRALEQMVQQRRFGPEYWTLHDDVLRLERVLAEMRGEPHAVELSLERGQAWPGMAHFTTVGGDSFNCSVLFITQTREHMALSFSSVAGYKLTDVSDEVIEGHPLTGKGLTAYGAFVVKNSPWVKELESIDRVHPQHAPERWRTSQHYLLCFKDRMFEAIARNVQLTGPFSTVDEALNLVVTYFKPMVR